MFQVFFIILAFFNLNIEQINIKTAFLYSFIDLLVYFDIPKKSKIEANHDMICKFLKTRSSLKYLLQLLYKKLLNFLL